MGRTFLVLLVFVAAVGDRASGQRTERVSVDSAGSQGDQSSNGLNSMSADGRFLAFTSHADNLVAGDGNWKVDVFVHDRLLGTTERVSLGSGGAEASGASFHASISADGRYVVEFPVADPNWLAREVLQYGAEAEVLAPEGMREFVRGMVG